MPKNRPAPYELIATCSSEIQAVILQTVLGMVYGAMWGGASVIWEIENWSLLKMTLSHLAICSTRNDMTEKEKMLAGLLYDTSDPELSALLVKARKLAR